MVQMTKGAMIDHILEKSSLLYIDLISWTFHGEMPNSIAIEYALVKT